MVLNTPRGRPRESRKALPESPGTPGVVVLTRRVQPAPESPRLLPFFGLDWLRPSRREEFP